MNFYDFFLFRLLKWWKVDCLLVRNMNLCGNNFYFILPNSLEVTSKSLHQINVVCFNDSQEMFHNFMLCFFSFFLDILRNCCWSFSLWGDVWNNIYYSLKTIALMMKQMYHFFVCLYVLLFSLEYHLNSLLLEDIKSHFNIISSIKYCMCKRVQTNKYLC